MNTQFLRQQVIAKILGELFEGTCRYGYEYPDRWNDPIEPSEEDVNEFRFKLAELARIHHEQRPISLLSKVEKCIKWTKNVGFKHGHVNSQWRTGVWGVRVGWLEDIITALKMPYGDLLPIGHKFMLHEQPYVFTRYAITPYHLGVYVKPAAPHELHEWSFTVEWDKIADVMPGGKYDQW